MSYLKPFSRICTVLSLVALAACAAPQPDVRSDWDKTVDFSRYRTYGIMESAGRTPTGEAYDTLLGQRLGAAIDREMTSRGYVKSDTPDLLVNFSVTIKDVTKVSQVPTGRASGTYYYRGRYHGWTGYQTETWVRQYEEGTLLIDIVDANRMQLVWEAAGTARLNKPLTEDMENRVNKAVTLLFQRYPFRAGP